MNSREIFRTEKRNRKAWLIIKILWSTTITTLTKGYQSTFGKIQQETLIYKSIVNFRAQRTFLRK